MYTDRKYQFNLERRRDILILHFPYYLKVLVEKKIDMVSVN